VCVCVGGGRGDALKLSAGAVDLEFDLLESTYTLTLCRKDSKALCKLKSVCLEVGRGR
jgi:hypothetical protein